MIEESHAKSRDIAGKKYGVIGIFVNLIPVSYTHLDVYKRQADKLGEGQFADLIETDTGYYLVRLDSKFDQEATDTKKDSIVSQRKSEAYSAKIQEWKDAADFQVDDKVWGKVNFDQPLEVKKMCIRDSAGTYAVQTSVNDDFVPDIPGGLWKYFLYLQQTVPTLIGEINNRSADVYKRQEKCSSSWKNRIYVTSEGLKGLPRYCSAIKINWRISSF